MKILVCGASYMMGPTAWPLYLKNKLNCDLVNISRKGCGNIYIHDAVLSQICNFSYDLVIVSWTVDKKIEFRTTYNDDMPDIAEFGHGTYLGNLQKGWCFPHTKFSKDLKIADTCVNEITAELFKTYFQVTANQELNHYNTLLKVLSLQSVLKSFEIPYVFNFYRPLLKLKKFNSCYEKIDWNNVHAQSLYHMAKKENSWYPDSRHPRPEIQEQYANMMYDFIKTKNLTKP